MYFIYRGSARLKAGWAMLIGDETLKGACQPRGGL